MLPRTNRLLQEKDFKRVSREGRYFRGNQLALKKARSVLAFSRFAFVISAKVSKKAVIRNKIRRRLREILRPQLNQVKPGFDVMVLVSPFAKDFDFKELKDSLNSLLKKAGLC